MSQSTHGETTGGIPAQTAFLYLLGKDIEVNPDRLQAGWVRISCNGSNRWFKT